LYRLVLVHRRTRCDALRAPPPRATVCLISLVHGCRRYHAYRCALPHLQVYLPLLCCLTASTVPRFAVTHLTLHYALTPLTCRHLPYLCRYTINIRGLHAHCRARTAMPRLLRSPLAPHTGPHRASCRTARRHRLDILPRSAALRNASRPRRDDTAAHLPHCRTARTAPTTVPRFTGWDAVLPLPRTRGCAVHLFSATTTHAPFRSRTWRIFWFSPVARSTHTHYALHAFAFTHVPLFTQFCHTRRLPPRYIATWTAGCIGYRYHS